MSTINNVVFKNMVYDGQMVKKWNHNGVEVFSAGATVVYNVDTNTPYVEEVDNGASCLSPKTFTPAKSGWTFVGWREDRTASSSVLSSKVMGTEPISLYAVFSKELTQTFISYNNTQTAKGTMYYNNGTVEYASITVPSGASYSGWTWRGWSLDTTADAPIHQDAGAAPLFGTEYTYYGCYQQTVTLKTIVNGSEYTNEEKQRYYNAAGNATTTVFTVSNPSKSDATFQGWSTGNDTSVEYTSVSGMTLTTNTTLYAVFKYDDVPVSRQFHNKQDPFMPEDGWAIPNGYMTLVSSVDFSRYSGITIAFDSVNLTQDWTTNTVYLTAECGGASVDLYSDYYDYTETHHKTATSGSATLNFAVSSGSGRCIIGFRGDGYCYGGSFGASGTLLGRTVVG